MNTTLKRFTLIWIAVLALLLVVSPRAFAKDIRVLLASSVQDAFTVYIEEGDYELLDDRGHTVTTIRRGAEVAIESYRSGFSIYIGGRLVQDGLSDFILDTANDDCLLEYNDKLYRGSLRVVQNGSSTYVINTLNLEHYLYAVVGREIGYNQPLEAVKSQAVVSRSFAMAKLNPANKYYDVGSGVSAQAYGGYAAEKEAAAGNVIRAVDATAGELVCYQGDPFESYYHSNAGGHTEDLANVWGNGIPLKGVPSPYDDYVEKSGYSSSIYQWQVSYTAAELCDLAERYAGYSIGQYQGVEVSNLGADGKPTVSGRVTEVVIKGSSGQVSAKREEIRALLGSLKSTLFSLDGQGGVASLSSFYVLDKGQTNPSPASDISTYSVRDSSSILTRLADWGGSFIAKGAQQSLTYSNSSSGSGNLSSSKTGNITIYGKGYGHGVGMSQWGAIGMAADGYNYEDILSHYFNMDANRDFTLEYYR